ncbi:MAG: SpoIIE family protein phosphatase [Halobacteriovoraceae bacterium]|jgi:PPM family protein phosphatase|nr:SpoIIE family protein phosphatase [Halobacteriovoraceae bacterium]
MELVNFSAETHQGPFLNVNEDGFSFDFEDEIYTVLDGFGGNGVGDKAVEELQVNIKRFYKNFVQDRNSTLPFFYSPRYLLEGNALINAALFSHHELYKSNLEKDVSIRAGSSGILMVKAESVISLLGLGNCRAYLLRKGRLISLFIEDSFRLLSKDKHESFLKNVPLSGFGMFADLHYQLREVRVTEGDKIILLTDGVYGRVDEDELQAAIISQTVNLRAKIHELFNISNSRGNLDNQTCMILEF